MERRGFIAGVAAAIVGPQMVRAERVRHIVALFPHGTDDPEQMVRRVALRLALDNIGWTDGRKAHVEYLHADDTTDYAKLAKAAVAQKPDLIFAQSTGLAAAIQRETKLIPIVFAEVADPVGAGFASSLSHPGGNMTGLMLLQPSVVGKWLSLLREIGPRLRRVALIGNSKTTAYGYFLHQTEAAAQKMGMQVVVRRLAEMEGLEEAIAPLSDSQDVGLVVVPGANLLRDRERVIGLAARYRLPALYPERSYALDGGLAAYGVAEPAEPFKQAAVYVDRILNGAKAGELAVQAPTRYSLTLNRATAKALGLALPHRLVAAADEVLD